MTRLMPLVVALLVSAAPAIAQSAPDVLRGTVRSDSGRAIGGAFVAVTRGSDRAVQQTTTDSLGRWSVRFAEGAGDYLVFTSAAGYTSARRRVTRQADEREFVVDLVLRNAVAARLATVRVQAPPPPRPGSPTISRGLEEVGASERWSDGVTGSLAPTARGNIAAIAATTAGLTVGAQGTSLLGAGAGSNLTTLNGLAIGSRSLPRAANVDVRVSGTSFDPTRGGFAGAQFDVQLDRGDDQIQRRRAFVTLDAPPLQLTDAVGRALGLRTTGTRVSLGADGQLFGRPYAYNTAVDYARTASDPASLLTADAATLARAGIPATSVPLVRAAAAQRGLPLSDGRVPGTRADETLTWLARLDHLGDTLRTLALTTVAQLDRRGVAGVGPTVAPAATADERDVSASAQLLHITYTGRDRRIYQEQRVGLSTQWQRVRPYLALPRADLLLAGPALDGEADIASVTLGGDPTVNVEARRWTSELFHQTIWLARGTRHRFNVAGWVRGDGTRDAAVRNAAGTFFFPSIDALAAGTPSSFARTLAAPARTGTVWNGALAASHRWSPSRQFQLLYGARLEHQRFVGAPAPNARLAQALGVRTDRLPTAVVLSPRAGFSWRPLNRPQSTGAATNNLGSFLRPSTNIIRGGIGLFRDLHRPALLADARAATGGDDGTELLRCAGAATPLTEWARWLEAPATLPSRCQGGAPVLVEQAPSVRAVAPGFDTPRSWRANLNWTTSLWRHVVRVEALGSRTVSQPSLVDVNLDRTARFTLEDGRPSFAPLAAFDPASGVVSTAASRRDTSFGRVRLLQSDLAARGVQYSLTVARDLFDGANRFYSVSYVWQRVQQQFRGSDGAGAGDPTRREWARGDDDARHAVLLQAGATLGGGVTVSVFSRWQSGLPFTPLVQGDLDGDGVAGDRAALIDPSRDPDPARAAQLRAVLRDAPASVRRCLERQFGRIAGRNSCTGPWTPSMNARIDFPLPARVVGRRTNASLNLANPLAGLDQLLHGSDGLKGWGAPARPDPTLFVVRGFDPTARRHRVDVNPRFGDTRPARTLLRDPFRATLDVAINLTRDPVQQGLERSIEPRRVAGRWVRPSADSVLRYYRRGTSSIHRVLLANSDTLFLTRAQIETFAKADTALQAAILALYTPLAATLSAHPMGAPTRGLLDQVNATEKAWWTLFYAQRDLVRSTLTPLQLSVAPVAVREVLKEDTSRDYARWARIRFTDDGSSVSISRF